MRLTEISRRVPLGVERDGTFESLGFVTHSTPQRLVFLEDGRYLGRIQKDPTISCIFTTGQFVKQLPNQVGLAVVDHPRKAFYAVHSYLAEKTDFFWSDFPSEISEDAFIHPSVHISNRNVRIGRGSIIEAGVTISERTIIGEDVFLEGCKIGGVFQFERSGDRVIRIPHAGGVKIGDRVEVHAYSTIDRAVFGGFTEVEEDTKIDKSVYVAHNVKIGKRCFLIGCSMLCGSVTLGDDVWIGPRAVVSSGLVVGGKAHVTIGSVVTRDVPAGQRVTGNFAIDHEKFISLLKAIR
jgi:UDP-3-O-[3-hydroxymyristoyl] glucosamine N-acyltransferase